MSSTSEIRSTTTTRAPSVANRSDSEQDQLGNAEKSTDTDYAADAAQDHGSAAFNVDVIIIGAGFSGVGMGIYLKRSGNNDFIILERESDVGGTWYMNRYPGCACDVFSHLYSFSFEPNPNWTRMFAGHAEIWEYVRHCCRKYGLMPHLRLNTEVQHLRFDERAGKWHVRVGDGRVYVATVVISAMGPLSRPTIPNIPGLNTFEGPTFHSQLWDYDIELEGHRVAVVGTGASSIQFVPQIQPKVEQLDLYQRSPPWIISKPDRAMMSWERWLFRNVPFTQSILRMVIYWILETRVLGFAVDPGFMKIAKRWAMNHLRSQVPDPELRSRLIPNYTIGCKRILMANDYYPALCKPNVDVVTSGIKEIRPRSIVTADGVERPCDRIIFGTGFEVQLPIPRGMVFGLKGQDLADSWKEGPQAYKGTAVAGFPNMFMILGPNTGLGHSSLILMIEAQARYIVKALKTMKANRWKYFAIKQEAQEAFNEKIQRWLSKSVWVVGGCNSWYLNESGKNTAIWPSFVSTFRSDLRHFESDDYHVTPNDVPGSRAASLNAVDGLSEEDMYEPLTQSEKASGIEEYVGSEKENQIDATELQPIVHASCQYEDRFVEVSADGVVSAPAKPAGAEECKQRGPQNQKHRSSQRQQQSNRSKNRQRPPKKPAGNKAH